MQLKELLEKNGHEVAVFSMQHPDNLHNDFSKYWPSEVDFKIKNFRNLIACTFRPFGVPEVKNKWKQLLNDFKPDIIHFHNIHSQLSPAIGKIAKSKNIPIVWTLHDYKILCPAYVLRRGSKVCELCIKSNLNVVRHKCVKNSLLASLIGYFESSVWNLKKLQKYTNTFIAPSNFIREKMIEGGLSKHNIIHLYNFMDDQKFRVSDIRKDYYVYVGRLSEEKGLNTLLNVASKLTHKTLKVVGDGPIRRKLEQEYTHKHIEFMGFQPWDKIKTLLGEAQFMVIPSEWYENNPLSTLESLALGTPVLGASIGGIPELINNNNGILFKSGNRQSLDVNLNRMFNYNWDYNRISEDARIKYSEFNYYKNLMQLYYSIIS
jgi:glycosyltransferase involved in cell wall biosynthesis